MPDLAVKKQAITPFEPLFAELETIAARAVPADEFADTGRILDALARVRADFERDTGRLAPHATAICGPDLAGYGAAATALFAQWEQEGGGPSMPALLALGVREWALDTRQPEVKAAFMAALLAEIPNDLQYHGNEHYRKVLLHTLRLIAAHNLIFAGRAERLSPVQMAQMLTAACVHDLGHRGGDNLRDGVYTPGFMEQLALDIARPYFDALDLDDDRRGEIETIVFCTDITFMAGDNSPCVRMKKLFRHIFWGDEVGDPSLLTMGRLRRYEDNPMLVRMAMMLHEADIATSAGLAYEQTRKETINIIEERGLKIAGPAIVLRFLREQLGQTMYSEAGKQLFGTAMEDIIRAAEHDCAAGRQTYYD